jgi:hypothetical protein
LSSLELLFCGSEHLTAGRCDSCSSGEGHQELIAVGEPEADEGHQDSRDEHGNRELAQAGEPRFVEDRLSAHAAQLVIEPAVTSRVSGAVAVGVPWMLPLLKYLTP